MPPRNKRNRNVPVEDTVSGSNNSDTITGATGDTVTGGTSATGAIGSTNMGVNEPAVPAFVEEHVAAIGGKYFEVGEVLQSYQSIFATDPATFTDLPDEGYAKLATLLGFRPTAADMTEAYGRDYGLTATRPAATSADTIAGVVASAAANRLDASDVRQVETDVVLGERVPVAGIGEALPAGIGETSIEPGASMPAVSTTRTSVLEAVAAKVMPPARSPVFPAGADPAGAILEGRAGNVQSVPRPGVTDWLAAVAATNRTAGLPHPEKDGGPVRIAAKREGFRRCGLAHGATPVDYPAGYFSMTEIRELEGEPMLVVQRLEWPQQFADTV